MKQFYLITILFSLTLLGCNSSAPPTPKGLTMNEVCDRYRERFAELARHLADIAGKLSPAGSVKKVSAPVTLDPLPVFFNTEKFKVRDADYKTATNTGLLSVEELSNMESKPELSLGPETDVNYPRANFRELKKPREYQTLEDRDGKLARDFETGLALRYLIVYRITKIERPIMTGSGFTPGFVDMEIFLVDLKSDQVVVSFPVSYKTGEKMYIPNKTSKDDNESSTVRAMEHQALSEIFKNLAATTRGKFEHSPPI